MGDFRMPSLGADMAQGTLVEWRVAPGDRVERGDVVALVDTDKAVIEVEVWESGVVDELLVPEGTRVPVGTVLARLHADGAAPAASPPAPAPLPASAEPPPPAPAPPVPIPAPAAAPAAVPPAGTPAAAGPVLASPAARRLAAELGVDLAAVRGTGPGGAVVRADVRRAQASPPPHHRRVSPVAARMAEALGVELAAVAGTGAGGAVTRADVERAAEKGDRGQGTGDRGQGTGDRGQGTGDSGRSGPKSAPTVEGKDRSAAMREAIATAVARSKREIPHYYLWTHLELRRALEWLAAENARRTMEERILPAALLLKATALALRDFPELNGFWIDGAFRPGAGIHPGVAVFLRGGGLVAPAILDADAKPVDALMRELGDLVRRARAGGLRGAEMTSSTLTVTNLGDRGVEGVLGVIYPPQVAIVGFGRIVERPWAEDGMVGVRPVVAATLAGDHRASDGHRGSLFLEKIGTLLQKPEAL